MSKQFNLSERVRSFRHAGAGFTALVRREHNARIHVAATLAVIVAGVAARLSAGEWAAIVLAMGLVFAAEASNTAFEIFCDVVHPDHHPSIGAAKDIAAAGVLASALAAALVGAFVFAPHVL